MSIEENATPDAAVTPDAAPAVAEVATVAPKDDGADDRDAIAALRGLSPRLFARLCRRIPLRPFLAELDKLDKGVFFRHFKGVRPQKIDGPYLERVIRKESFERNDGMLAQLAIFNWDEAEHRL